jgi:hypothetical protein
LDEHRTLELLRQFTQARYFFFSDAVAECTIVAAHFTGGRTF